MLKILTDSQKNMQFTSATPINVQNVHNFVKIHHICHISPRDLVSLGSSVMLGFFHFLISKVGGSILHSIVKMHVSISTFWCIPARCLCQNWFYWLTLL